MKRKFSVALFLSSLLLLGSCQGEVNFVAYTSSISDEDTYVYEDHEHYFKPAGFNLSYRDILMSSKNDRTKIVPLKSKEEQKILVLPVTFPNYPLDNLDGNNGKTAHIHLQNAFFGQNELTAWRSVSGFYHESSYGKLRISGEVAPWFVLPAEYHTDLIRERVRSNSDKLNETARITNHALVRYNELFPDKLKEFDTDDDGIIDGVYVIYAAPYETKDCSNIFWAFASNMNRLESKLPVQANAYSWSSYHYLNMQEFKKPDAHTFIHEVGHILGLTDYYNTNYNDPYSPLGGFDMMDYTVGDHTAFSKLLLEWSRPYVVKSSGTIKLRPFTESGDTLLLKTNWNGNATDEYLLLEYYAPAGLNELDSRLNAPFKLPRINGVKVYHVDARTMYEVKEGSITRYYYTSEYQEPQAWPQVMAHSNSSGPQNTAPGGDFKLYKLLEPNESKNISGNFKLANSSSLFQKGHDFGEKHFKNFVFNDTTPFGYKVYIEDMNREYVTIKVEVL